jgi:hypothetical protein
MTQLFKNNATGTLSVAIASALTTSLVLQAGQGASFPSPTGGDFFTLTLIGRDVNGAENSWEIVNVTARSSDTLTVVRGQEGTTAAAAWGVGTSVSLRMTAGTLASLAPKAGAVLTSPVVDSLNGGQLAGFRNRIINGDMRIDQRNKGAAVIPLSSASFYACDRFSSVCTQSSKYSMQQIAAAAGLGFSNWLNAVSLSAYAVIAADTFGFFQAIEGLNVQDLNFGTAAAKPITISFTAQSSVVGTHSGAVVNSAGTRSYPFTYNIAAANTPTKISVTIPGDTSGTWLTDTGAGLLLRFNLGSGANFSGAAGSWQVGNFVGATGAVSVVAINGATASISQVQLELGSSATPFEQRPIQVEQALCERYLPSWTVAGVSGTYAGMAYSTSVVVIGLPMRVKTRVPPTGVSVTSSNFQVTQNNGALTGSGGLTILPSSVDCMTVQPVAAAGLVAGNVTQLATSGTPSTIFGTGCEL